MRTLVTFLLLVSSLAAHPGEPEKQEQAYFAEHSANLKRLRTEGKLLLGGRSSDKGIIIVKAASE